eukprot:scaffold34318_cov32-Tisochrysis_lutea.AAC.2
MARAVMLAERWRIRTCGRTRRGASPAECGLGRCSPSAGTARPSPSSRHRTRAQPWPRETTRSCAQTHACVPRYA